MKKSLSFILIIIYQFIFAQVTKDKDSLQIIENEIITNDLKIIKNLSNTSTLSPSKAAWRSAILPGWGQYYNKKYWKIPIVWGAIGTGIGFIIWNQRQYNRYKRAFNAELNGQTHEFSDIEGIDLKNALGNTQDSRRRYRDYAIAITAGIYILNIVDAIVDAHLYEGRKDPDLAISPSILHDYTNPKHTAKAGFTVRYKF